MGLDMYLTGEKHFIERPRRRGDLKSHRFDLGYWRKHPNLHNYIVSRFAGRMDDGHEIELSAGDLEQILSAVEQRQLPHTEGVFFGKSSESERTRDIQIISDALKWLNASTESEHRSVCYQASW